MQALTASTPNPAHIADVPGLYISDITIPSSPTHLTSHGITHVLTLLTSRARLTIPENLGIVHKSIELEDDAFADLLGILPAAIDFIEAALHAPLASRSRSGKCEEGSGISHVGGGIVEEERGREVGLREKGEKRVLVHCLQGISRSGAVIVAYLMKHLHIPYPAALSVARKYRPVITINKGFEEQLELWEWMDYNVYDEQGGEKTLYSDWKERRDGMMMIGEETLGRERGRSMASVAARVGRLRMGARGEEKER